ncbi:MAG: hypothetical protein RLZZ293_508 [Pseudomonadota bacterium]|jgi:NodT family efflux transporter outer membrane factor (OMF) lipoprotein
MKIKNLIAISLATGLIGCALMGPDYHKPNTNDPQQLPNQNRDLLATTESANLPMLAWWKNFNDPQLNQLIESALINNNNIQIAIGNIEAARGQLRQIEFAWLPIVGGNASYTNQAKGQYSLSFTPSYSLNIFQLIRAQEYAKANFEAVKAAKDTVRLSIISQVATGYFTLLGQDYQLQLQQQLVADLSELLALAKLQYQAGLYSLYQLQSYEQQYATAQAQIPIIQNNIIVAQNALRVLLNQNPGDIKRGEKFNQLNSYGIIPINLPSNILRNRPDIRQAEQQLIMANANIGVAVATFFPTINLTGAGGVASGSLNSLFGSNTDFWTTTAGATMPILNFGIYGQIQTAKGEYYAAYYNYLQTVRSAFAAVDNDLSAHQQLTLSMQQQEKFYQSTQLSYQLAESSFTQGLFSKPQLLQSDVALTQAALSLQQSKLQQLGTIVQLYQDLGGGYAYQNYESTIKFNDSHD